MTNTVAVLDLGTNTFHLLIASKRSDKDFDVIFRKRVFVKLADEGINRLGQAPMQRGLDALVDFMQLIAEYQVDQTVAVGTAALRTATNGHAYLQSIDEKTGLKVQIIDGLREAALIHKGVSQVWNPTSFPVLIMDIGGGSVEFIIADGNKVHWSISLPIGVSVLYRGYHHNDPISTAERCAMVAFLEEHLGILLAPLQQYQPQILVGASGTFDVIADIFEIDPDQPYDTLPTKGVTKLLDEISHMTWADRMAHPGISDSRIDMIVVAVILLQQVLQLSDFAAVDISRYALKEGLIAEMLEG